MQHMDFTSVLRLHFDSVASLATYLIIVSEDGKEMYA